MSLHDQPRVVFGRRNHMPAPPSVTDRKAKPAKAPKPVAVPKAGVPKARAPVFMGVLAAVLAIIQVAALFWAMTGSQAFKDEAARAQARVVAIVNQPVTHLPRTPVAAYYPQGWFHPGAIKPDFNTVDVRATQDLTYARFPYVTSSLNPTEMFIGGEVEFNAMTKYFYTDRSLPKKKLSEAEMLEINHLYRVIGHDQQAATRRWEILGGLFAAALILAAAASYLADRRRPGT